MYLDKFTRRLLAKYARSSPLNWALIKNHKFIELNVIKVQNKIDSGDIILSKKIKDK